MTARRRGQRGLALIVVLWSAVLVTVLAAGFAFSTRTEARLAAGVVERARAGAAAEAGVRALMAALVAAGRRGPLPEDAVLDFDGTRVALAVRPENARVDLNAAPEPLIESLIAHVGAALEPRPAAGAVAAAILDWRDADEVARPAGAEAVHYESAGLPGRPRNGAFLSTSELSAVMGVSPSLFAALQPLVTVYAWSPQVDPMSAPRDVLLALPEMSAGQVDAFLEARAADPGNRQAITLLAGAQRYLARSRGSVFSLVARAETASGVRAVRRAVVKVNGSTRTPLSVLAWFEEAPAGGDADAVPATDAPAGGKG